MEHKMEFRETTKPLQMKDKHKYILKIIQNISMKFVYQMSNPYKSTKVRALYVTGDCECEFWIILCYSMEFKI